MHPRPKRTTGFPNAGCGAGRWTRHGSHRVVTVNGTVRPLAETLDSFPVAGTADWYIKGMPLVTGTGLNRLRLFTYGSPRFLTSEFLVFFGYIEATPIYADRLEAEAILKDLAAIYHHRPRRELGDVLAENANMRVYIENVRVFYVPLSRVGCIFQAVVRDEDVR
jgi:hypothetical protein